MTNAKGGRPVTKTPQQFHDIAREIIEEEQRWKEAEARRLGIIQRLDEQQIWALLRFFFDGSLARWDDEDVLPVKMSRQLRDFFSTTSDKTLVQKASHQLVQDIIDVMMTEDVEIGGIKYERFQVYALRVYMGLDNPFSADNELIPIPLPVHIRQAYERFAVLVNDMILDK